MIITAAAMPFLSVATGLLAGEPATIGHAPRAAGIDGIVLTPDGKPAVKAIVALAVPFSATWIHNGQIDTERGDAETVETDDSGKFHFGSEKSNFTLVVTHSTGYAQYQPKPKSGHRIINLDSWTRVEGTCRAGGRPRANAPITIQNADLVPYNGSVPQISWSYSTTSDARGQFLFKRVRAGRGWIGRNLTVELREKWEAMSACRVLVRLPVGKTVHVDLGRPSRTLVGRFRAPAGCKKKVRWSSALLWIDVKEGKELPRGSYFEASIGTDGAFRIDDLPPGDYTYSVRLSQRGVGEISRRALTMPVAESNDVAKPTDLGEITLDKER